MTVTTTQKSPASKPAEYEEDFYTWLNEQAALLRARAFDEIDIENLAEEIEDLGKEQFNKLVSAYRIIVLHMLKWDHQPTHRSRSWALSIAERRVGLADVLEMNPGLKSRRTEALARAYRAARIKAANETNLPLQSFPEDCPYASADLTDREFPAD